MPFGFNFFNQKAQRVVKGIPRKVFSQQDRKGHKGGIFQDQTFAALLCQFFFLVGRLGLQSFLKDQPANSVL
jgi:hypothetical protein